MREKVEKFISGWERGAKESMFLDGPLHPRIRTTLIDGLVSVFEQEAEAAANGDPAKQPKKRKSA